MRHRYMRGLTFVLCLIPQGVFFRYARNIKYDIIISLLWHSYARYAPVAQLDRATDF